MEVRARTAQTRISGLVFIGIGGLRCRTLNWLLPVERVPVRVLMPLKTEPRLPLVLSALVAPGGAGAAPPPPVVAGGPFVTINGSTVVGIGLGRIVALHHRSSTSYQIR